MDEFIPQTGGLEVKEGHEESDINVRAIVTCLACLAIAGALTFVIGGLLVSDIRFIGLQYWERRLFGEPQLTAAQQQLQAEREVKAGTAPKPGEAVRTPDWYGRVEMEGHLGTTFPTPRLQYDDEFDLNIFRDSEEKWLDSTGKSADGAIHIPVAHAMDLLSQRGLPPVSGAFLPANAPANVLAPELSPGPGHPTTTKAGGSSR
jgi:hypothetical protein